MGAPKNGGAGVIYPVIAIKNINFNSLITLRTMQKLSRPDPLEKYPALRIIVSVWWISYLILTIVRIVNEKMNLNLNKETIIDISFVFLGFGLLLGITYIILRLVIRKISNEGSQHQT